MTGMTWEKKQQQGTALPDVIHCEAPEDESHIGKKEQQRKEEKKKS